MRLIIEARLEGEQARATAAEATIVAVVERQDRSVAGLGLTLAEGRALLAEVQWMMVSQQTAGWMAGRAACRRCGSVLAHKDSRSIVMRTVFGKVEAEPEIVGMQLRGQARRATPLRESAVHGCAATSHPGIGVPSGQVGCPSALSAGH